VQHRLRAAARIGQPPRALDHRVVGPEQRRDLRGVRRAARVLEQQRVEDRRTARVIETERRGELHADHAAPLGVTARLALGHIQCMRQRRSISDSRNSK
jgi:hypothetical protein